MFIGNLLGTSYLRKEEDELFDEIVEQRRGHLVELRKLVKFVHSYKGNAEINKELTLKIENLRQTVQAICNDLHFAVNFEKGTIRAKTIKEIFPND